MLGLRKATVEDVASITDIYFSAFSIDAISLLCFPRNNGAVYSWWFDMITDEVSQPGAHHLVVTIPCATNPSHGEIIAWALWNAPAASTSSPSTLPLWPLGCDVGLANYFFGNLIDRRKQIMGARPYWYLELIATRPDWQGQGAAGKLLRWGLERADREGVEAYIEASLDGKQIYERFGFQEVAKLAVDLSGRDPCRTGETHFVEAMMVRAARNSDRTPTHWR
ncbi:acetyltransferas-like protein [Calycina marina]|uniref:Acetyltransferas-like protein n=1 Tax=Calycina marina TaxID=1763456 RepID=A0A9P7YZC5_9HELO|nr:acetyltransferas-like protein [Calycina marina]